MEHYKSSLLIVGLVLLIATGLDWNADLTWHDQHRIGQIFLLGVMAVGSLTVWRHDIAESIMLLPCRVIAGIVLVFGWGLVSAITATYPRFAGLEWSTLFLLLGMALVLAGQARFEKIVFDVWAIRIVVVLAVVIVLKIMMGYLAAMIVMGHLDTILLFEGTFSNRRFFGQAASMMVPLLAYPLLRGGLASWGRFSFFLLLGGWWMLVIVSGTRGTWVALAVAAILLSAFAWRACAGWLRIQVLGLGTGAILFVILFVWLPLWIGIDASIENRWSNLATLSGREVLWALAWEQIQSHPWLGVGPMHLAAIRNDFGAHPHNSLLQIAAEWGLPVVLALFLLAAAGILRLLLTLRLNPNIPNVLLVCLTASLLAAITQSMVDGVMVIPYTQTLLALVGGWALGVYFREGGVMPMGAESRMVSLTIPVVAVSALAAMLYGVIPEFFNRAEVTQDYVDSGKLIPPRYWAVGWIP